MEQDAGVFHRRFEASSVLRETFVSLSVRFECSLLAASSDCGWVVKYIYFECVIRVYS